jgi:hypothetical protein
MNRASRSVLSRVDRMTHSFGTGALLGGVSGAVYGGYCCASDRHHTWDDYLIAVPVYSAVGMGMGYVWPVTSLWVIGGGVGYLIHKVSNHRSGSK